MISSSTGTPRKLESLDFTHTFSFVTGLTPCNNINYIAVALTYIIIAYIMSKNMCHYSADMNRDIYSTLQNMNKSKL